MSEIPLSQLHLGVQATVTAVLLHGAVQRRFYDIGCIKGAVIRPVVTAPFGGSRAYALCGSLFAIRDRDAAYIRVRDGNI